jgi:DNA-binding CsgD family transcriptional regulator
MRATRELLGRDEELGAVARLLDGREELPGAIVLHGQAGIGKTSVWLAGIDAARERGYRILSSRPSEAEARLSFAGLSDLLGGVASDVLPELPPIQQRALEAALLLGDAEGGADERAVAASLLAALRSLATDRPVCLAVDDLQWLDPASLAALQFAMSRIVHEPVAALFAARGGHVPSWLRRMLHETTLRTFELAGLSIGAVHELLHAQLGATFPRPTLVRIWETSAGNPFFALELAAALERRGGTLAPGDPLPVPADLEQLLRERLDGLSRTALEASHVAAAVADPTTNLLEAALGKRADAGLVEALDARILELDGDRVRFTHPLLGSAVAARLTPARRRGLHGLLATLVSTDEERARHVALATDEPNAAIASDLEAAAASAHARGAPASAAELAEHALRLTAVADDADARRRQLVAAEMHYAAGDFARATELLEEALSAAEPGPARATVLVQLAKAKPQARTAVALYRQALSDAEADDALQAAIHLSLAGLMRFADGIERGIEHAELAVRASARVEDVPLRCRALAAYGLVHFNAGRGIPEAEMDEALRLERTLAGWPLEEGPTAVFGHQLCWSAEVGRARRLFHEAHDAVRARSDPRWESTALWYLGLVEWRAGNWTDAARYAAGALELDTQLGVVTLPSEYPTAIIDAHSGRVDAARTRALAAVARAEEERMSIAESGFSWVLGFVELSLGNPATALTHLRRTTERRRAFVLEPGMHLGVGDLLEALIANGELDEADDVLAADEGRATALDRAWALAILARCRGLLFAARGNFEGAFLAFERALAEHARTTDPFHHARTLLALGRTQRRAKRRGAARATLEDAQARFEALGAPLWAAQTRAELARIGGRAPSRGELTEAERRIAALVTEGHTNREVAAALFLTEHSVETALTRIYRKLGVRSRAELGRVLSNS